MVALKRKGLLYAVFKPVEHQTYHILYEALVEEFPLQYIFRKELICILVLPVHSEQIPQYFVQFFKRN